MSDTRTNSKVHSRTPSPEETQRRVSQKVSKGSTIRYGLSLPSNSYPPLFPLLKGTPDKFKRAQTWIENESNAADLLASQSDEAYETCSQAAQLAISTCSLPLSMKTLHLETEAKSAIDQLASKIGAQTFEAISNCNFTEFKQTWCQRIGDIYFTYNDIKTLAEHVNDLKQWWWNGGLNIGDYSVVSTMEDLYAQARGVLMVESRVYKKMVVTKGLDLERRNVYEALLLLLD